YSCPLTKPFGTYPNSLSQFSQIRAKLPSHSLNRHPIADHPQSVPAWPPHVRGHRLSLARFPCFPRLFSVPMLVGQNERTQALNPQETCAPALLATIPQESPALFLPDAYPVRAHRRADLAMLLSLQVIPFSRF